MIIIISNIHKNDLTIAINYIVDFYNKAIFTRFCHNVNRYILSFASLSRYDCIDL